MPDNLSNSASFYEAILKQAVIQDYWQELASIPSEQELAKTLSYSPRHIAQMKKLFTQEARREFARSFFSIAKKTAVAAAIVGAILSCLLMLNPNVRAVVVDTIVEWFETFTRFQSPQVETTTFDTELRPSYVPEGFVEADVFEDDEGKAVTVFYRSNTGRINLTYLPLDSSVSVDNEDTAYHEETIEGVHFYIFETGSLDKDNRLVWENMGIRFTLSSMISTDELLLMAQSIPQ